MAVVPPPSLKLAGEMPAYGPELWKVEWNGNPASPTIYIHCDNIHRDLSGTIQYIVELHSELDPMFSDAAKLSEVTDKILAVLANGGQFNREYLGIPPGGALRMDQVVFMKYM